MGWVCIIFMMFLVLYSYMAAYIPFWLKLKVICAVVLISHFARLISHLDIGSQLGIVELDVIFNLQQRDTSKLIMSYLILRDIKTKYTPYRQH